MNNYIIIMFEKKVFCVKKENEQKDDKNEWKNNIYWTIEWLCIKLIFQAKFKDHRYRAQWMICY